MTTLVKPDGSQIKKTDKKVNIPTEKEKISNMLDKLPNPTGWRILVRPYSPPSKTKGGLHLADETQEKITVASVCALVMKVGPLAYKDETKFPEGPWCKEGQWVMFGKYAGSRFNTEIGEVRILIDDEIIGTINDPAHITTNF